MVCMPPLNLNHTIKLKILVYAEVCKGYIMGTLKTIYSQRILKVH